MKNSFNNDLNKKVSLNELKSLLTDKVDREDFENKIISFDDFSNYKNLVDSMANEFKNKLDITQFDQVIKTFNKNFENIHMDINTKANIKEILSFLKNKAEVDDVNKALIDIHNEIEKKINFDDFTNAMDNQAIINDALCNENSLGRWLWKSGKLNNNLIPWEIQSVNTSPDNFIWENGNNFIMINLKGLYEINCAFYNDKKPNIQIMINGEVILSAINSNSYVVHQSNGGRLKGIGKTSFGNVTGLSMIDYIMLPDKAKLQISYVGDEGGIGFVGLKKL